MNALKVMRNSTRSFPLLWFSCAGTGIALIMVSMSPIVFEILVKRDLKRFNAEQGG